MKQLLLVCLFSGVAVFAMATPLIVQDTQKDYWQYIDNVLYKCDYTAQTAIVSDLYAKYGMHYTQSHILIPASFVLQGIGTGDDYSKTMQVIAVADNAFSGAECTSLSFAEPSNVKTIGGAALSNMPNLSQDTLTLPASLDSLALSAILLPEIKYIRFLGTTPPRCAVATDGDAINPWTSASEITMPTVQVLVPEGTWNAYKETKGIGDYFSCFQGETPTGITEMANAPAKAQKVMRNGQLLIEKAGVLYTVEGRNIGK